MPDKKYQIGVEIGATGTGELKKTIADLQAQLKRFQSGLQFAGSLDSIGRLNRGMAGIQERISALKNFTGLDKPFEEAAGGANELSSSLADVIAQALRAKEALNIAPTVAAPAIPSFDNLSAGQAALDRITASIDRMGDEARETTIELVNLGNARFPLTSINNYRAAVLKIKQEIAGGFTPKFSTQTIDPRLSPRVTADLRKSLADLTAQAARFREAMNNSKSSESIARLGRGLQEIEKRIQAINKTSGGTAGGLGAFTKSSGSAALAVTNLGRVLQDAPFGFIGIANNLNPLLESFQRLRAETGSTGKTLKALAGSLVGAGGIGLALSAVTFVAAGGIDTIKKFFAQFGDANENITKAKQFLSELKSSFDIRIEGGGSVQGEIAKVAALANVVRDETAAKRDRLAAIQELQKINKNYFGDLSLEKSSVEGLAAAQQEYTKALIEQAVIKGFSEEISKTSVELSRQKKALADLGKQYLIAGDAAQVARRKLNALDLTGQGAFAAGPLGEAFAKAQSAADKASQAYTQQAEIVNKLQSNINDYTKEINAAVEASLKLKPLTSDREGNSSVDQLQKRLDTLEKIRTTQQAVVKEQVEGFRDARKAVAELINTEEQIFDLKLKITLRDATKNGLSKDDIEGLRASYQKELDEAFNQQANILEGNAKVNASLSFARVEIESLKDGEIESKVAKATGLDKEIKIKEPLKVRPRIDRREFFLGLAGPENVGAAQQAAQTLAENFSNTFANIVGQAMVDSFAAIGEGIANVFSGGSLQDLVKPLLSVVADAIISLGKAAIQFGIQMEVIQKALKAAFKNPYVAIAAGIAAVAIGTILKNSINNKKLKGFESGGVVSGPSSGYPVMLHGTEAIVPLSNNRFPFGVGGAQEITVVGQLRGQDIYLSNQRTTKSKRRL